MLYFSDTIHVVAIFKYVNQIKCIKSPSLNEVCSIKIIPIYRFGLGLPCQRFVFLTNTEKEEKEEE